MIHIDNGEGHECVCDEDFEWVAANDRCEKVCGKNQHVGSDATECLCDTDYID